LNHKLVSFLLDTLIFKTSFFNDIIYFVQCIDELKASYPGHITKLQEHHRTTSTLLQHLHLLQPENRTTANR